MKTMTFHPKVAIVVLNWNKKDYVLSLLDSLQSIEYENYEITLVDNASTDGSVEAIKERFPNIDIIVNPENLGAADGANIGMKHALKKESYKYLWRLDNDAVVEKNTLTKLVEVMESDEKIGVCGCAFYDYHNKNFLVDCGNFVNKCGGLKGFSGENVELSQEPFDVDFVIVASALIRAQAAKEVDFIDQRYFFDWEDIDFCITLKRNGYKVVSVPAAKVYHKPFLPGERPLNFYYSYRNRLLFTSKYISPFRRAKTVYSILRNMMKILVYSYLQSQKNDMDKIKFAVIDFLNNRWGQHKLTTSSDLPEGVSIRELLRRIDKNKKLKFLIFPSGNQNDINKLLSNLVQLRNESNRDWILYLSIPSKRVPLIKADLADKVIDENQARSKFPLVKRLVFFIKIMLYRFDVAIDTAPREILINYYAVPQVFRWDSKTELFYCTKENIYKIWKIPLAYIVGEIFALIVFPLVFIKSFSYQIKAH